MIVVKLGGSLVESGALLKCLDVVEQKYQGRTVVIVPGGGRFADEVRRSQMRWQFDDKAAHHMAILAMQQMALLFKAFKSDFNIVHSLAAIEDAHSVQKNILIWSPDFQELDSAGIPATWDITSDSLAAWLAKTLSATELVLVKSAKIDENLSAEELIEKNIVDRAFFDFISQASFRLHLIHKDNFY